MMVGSGSGCASGPEDGFLTAGFVVAVGFSMLFFVLLANLMAVQYARGVVRVALDEGARHGARYGAAGPACENRIREVLDGLLGGQMSSGVSFRCEGDSSRTSAGAQVAFPAWVPGVPEFRFRMAATAAVERK
ncbi:MAG: hypothetical protein F4W94_09880 [Acidimicrobiia bacterium]|nr:hypothetical protein [Acidimicrobiia bacterium]MYB79315.1 hypothetical protein [Acidimicrobiia bacterium]MYD42015.1 hypothetical protein [Acidimicrobiia bacterium]MYG91685.1 hypothetical protein [Acidimicrobiia bacterium]MYK55250.1 hypothetical protein [Acidimicrobiia bacterium]